MRSFPVALCAVAFATILVLSSPRAEAATPAQRGEPTPTLRADSNDTSRFPRSEPPASGEVDESWVGRFCTPTGCSGGPSSPLAQAASFGAATGTIAFLARRRRA